MNRYRRNRSARGLSIIELLVGITVGLFVLTGATMVATNQISDNRRLLLETQIQQDMRTAMDIVVRDIRRSGYGFHADEIPAVGAPLPKEYPFQPAGVLNSANPLLYTYSYENGPDDNGVVDDRDFRGFMLEDGVIKVRLGKNNWQPLTDGETVEIKTFKAEAIPISTRNLTTETCSGSSCPSSNGCGDARVVSRIIRLTMEGTARHDPTVKRTLVNSVRVRNDEVCL